MSSPTHFRRPDERGELLDRSLDLAPHVPRSARQEDYLVDDQLAARALEPRIDAADDPISRQDGHGKVAELPEVEREVDLHPVAVAEELLGAGAVDDQVVEGREQLFGYRYRME